MKIVIYVLIELSIACYLNTYYTRAIILVGTEVLSFYQFHFLSPRFRNIES